ncbi:MAG: SpoIIE family protein phosphatase [Verrucomicrobia bacterium]|nr:SpoIIE family protein phosphatase [Verrucomicrobiota bacterium]
MSDASVTPAAPATASLDASILHVLMETIPDRIYFKDVQSRFVRNNVAHARWIGATSPDACVGKTDFDFFSQEHATRAFLEEQVIIRTGRPIINRIDRITRRDGTQTWGSVTKMPWCDAEGRVIGTFGLTRDVTAAKAAEEKLTEERNLLRTIIDHLPSRVYVKDTSSRYVLNNEAHLRSLGVKLQAEAAGHITTDFFPGERGHQALADDTQVFAGHPILNQEKSDHGAAGNVHWALTTKVPLHDVRGQLVGLVGISHDITRRKLAELKLEQHNAEMEADVRMARQIQESFLPHDYPAFPRGAARSALRFAHRYIPATTLGGDFFDLLQLSDTQCGMLLCDVMGHGVRAGLLTALIRGVVGEMGPRATDPAHVLAEINHSLDPILAQLGEPVFATAFFGVIDTAARTLTYGNAGHPPPFVLTPDAPEPLALAPADPEPATGLVPGFPYSNATCAFPPGSILLAYTDGVLEAADAAGNLFGDARLRAVLTHNRGRTGDETLAQLVRDVETFSGTSVFEDDVCLVAVEAART